MISILIPVYNYKIQPLVDNLILQLNDQNLYWEILISDDASNDVFKKENNSYIHSLKNISVKIFQQELNVGNGGNRNYLISIASYEWLLFLDADVMPVYSNFISIYLNHISNSKEIVAGNIMYDENNKLPNLLRWKYGKKKEQKTLNYRKTYPILNIRGANFLIKRTLALNFPFPVLLEKYGFIDTRFFLQFSEDNIDVIENPVFHLGIESNEVFLNKTKNAVANALYLFSKKDQLANQISIVSTYKKFYFLKWILAQIYCMINENLEKNLLSKNPSIFFFQIYKILYMSYLDVFKKTQ